MNQDGRLVIREYSSSLKEALNAFSDTKNRLENLLSEAYDSIDLVKDQEQDKLSNLELSGTGLDSTPLAENLRDSIDTLDMFLSEISSLQDWLDFTEEDPTNLSLDDLKKLSRTVKR
ncbi:hypothetical protein [Deinococcus sp. AJ005]|uniref:hypothetical protein n=1 Tax=Deinococcus sp. AJ005 TaxID=2652443 RepID=UPI00125CC729|nr:hypothetical protein [Deinococcus sp. AJ005]QFP77060.1 hypothetical protein DAAJ005_11840 [Deinococcus sp. AJ005]